ncbi:MAG: discoidin domain-containing protein [bacterium]
MSIKKIFLFGLILSNPSFALEVATNTAIIKGESIVYGESLDKMDNFAFAFGEDKVILPGLLPGTTYWYRTNGLLGSFTTKGSPPIRCGNLVFPSITKDKALLSAELYNLLPDCEYLVTLTIEQGKEKASSSILFKTAENNLALNGRVSGTFDQLPADKYVKGGNPLQRLTDGDLSYFKGMAQSQDITQNDQWLLIDLGRITRISTLTVYWRALAYSQDYAIEGSMNGKDWVVLASGLNADNGIYLRSETGDPMRVLTTNCQEETTNGQKFRYVKLLAKKGSKFFHKHIDWNFIQIMEVKVF